MNTISPEKPALAVIPKQKRKEGSDYNEKDESATIVLRLVIVEKSAGNCMDILYTGVEEGVVIQDQTMLIFLVHSRMLPLLQIERKKVCHARGANSPTF